MLSPGTVAFGESYTSYHLPRITDYTKVPHITICIISGHCQYTAPWHAIKVDADECMYVNWLEAGGECGKSEYR